MKDMSGCIMPEKNCDFHALAYSLRLIASNCAFIFPSALYALMTLCPA